MSSKILEMSTALVYLESVREKERGGRERESRKGDIIVQLLRYCIGRPSCVKIRHMNSALIEMFRVFVSIFAQDGPG